MKRNLRVKRIVIKIGTNTITNKEGMLDFKIVKNLISQIARIKDKKEILIITSGAIASGMKELGLKRRPDNVVVRQVCAAIGQNILMTNYYSLFREHKIKIAQILLKYGDFSDKEAYKNLHNSITKLLQLQVIPIINENDPISINEIGFSFGDNDNLSALIAANLDVGLLIILTNVNGLYDKDPKNKDAVMIKEVKNIDNKIKSMGGKASALGLGGMKTKIQAAKTATKAGTTVIIANGRKKNVLIKILKNEEIGTIFYPKKMQ